MERPNREDYIRQSTIMELISKLEVYIDFLEAKIKLIKAYGDEENN